MSMPYYCHACQRPVQAEADQVLQCSRCHSEFIESMVDEDIHDIHDIHTHSDEEHDGPQFQMGGEDVLRMFFGAIQASQNAQNPTASTPNSSNPTSSNPNAPRQHGDGNPGSSRQPQFQGMVGSMFSNFFSPPATSSRTTERPRTNSEPRSNSQPANDPHQNQPEIFGELLAQLFANASANTPGGSTFQFQFNSPAIHGNINNYVFGEHNFDELISNLMNSTEPQQPGLSQEDLNGLEKAKIEQIQVDNGVQCTTCMDTYKLGEDVIKLECKHVFHRDCIFPWLVKSRTCPICRQEIEPKNKNDSAVISDIDELD